MHFVKIITGNVFGEGESSFATTNRNGSNLKEIEEKEEEGRASPRENDLKPAKRGSKRNSKRPRKRQGSGDGSGDE